MSTPKDAPASEPNNHHAGQHKIVYRASGAGDRYCWDWIIEKDDWTNRPGVIFIFTEAAPGVGRLQGGGWASQPNTCVLRDCLPLVDRRLGS